MAGPKWYEAGTTQLNQLPEPGGITIPTAGGAAVSMRIQKAGFMRKIRGYLKAIVAQSAGTGAPTKSAYGALGGSMKRLQCSVAGRLPFFSLSGLSLAFYNEIANPDASIFAPPAFLSAAGESVVTEAKHLTEHDAATTGVVNYDVRHPFELPFGIPIWLTNVIRKPALKDQADAFLAAMVEEEIGLWYLQERKTELVLDTEFYPAYVASGPKAPYSAGTGVVATWDTANSRVNVERELYDVPQGDPRMTFPEQRMVHRVVEYEQAIAGKAFNWPVDQIGALLRLGIIMLDSTDALVEWEDLLELTWSYGVSDTPINRAGHFLTSEYLQDYDRYPPKGMVVLDFWKAGRYANKLARNTDAVANLAVKGTFSATTTGKVLIIAESLVPQAVEVVQ